MLHFLTLPPTQCTHLFKHLSHKGRKLFSHKIVIYHLSVTSCNHIGIGTYKLIPKTEHLIHNLVNCFLARNFTDRLGSKYLRYALIEATKCVCIWDTTFAAYLEKKRGEGKHYNVAISHAAKKLVRTIYAMEKSGEKYQKEK